MRRTALVALSIATAALAACGLSSTGTGENPSDDAGVTADVSTPAEDSGPPVTVDASVAVDAGVVDAGGAIHCPKTGQSVTNCSQCGGNPLHCYLCGPNNTHYDVCVPQGSACLSQYGTGMNLDWCRCAYPSAASCPLPEQECNSVKGGSCVTCGENLTSNFQCKVGGTCRQSSATCN